MQFDETNKVIISTLNRDEARAFVLFLKSEIARHKLDIDNKVSLCYDVCMKFKIADMLEEY